jgi:hypothetical protein
MSDFETYLIPIEIVRKVNNSINFVMFQAVIEVVAQVVDIHTAIFFSHVVGKSLQLCVGLIDIIPDCQVFKHSCTDERRDRDFFV